MAAAKADLERELAAIADAERRLVFASFSNEDGIALGLAGSLEKESAVLGRSKGRDHHPNAFTMWLAGGGIRGGVTYGETDELGFHIARDEVHVHDLQATILHCLGLDHERLTYRYQGRDFRLTDVHGHVVRGILS